MDSFTSFTILAASAASASRRFRQPVLQNLAHERDSGQVLAQTVVQILTDSAPFRFADFENCFLQTFALADIANRARNQHALFRFQRTEADLHRELVPVLVQAVQFHARAHGPHARLGDETSAMAGMLAAQTLRHQFLDLLSQQFLPAIAEQFLDLGVHQNNLPALVDHHDGIRRRFQQARNFASAPASAR